MRLEPPSSPSLRVGVAIALLGITPACDEDPCPTACDNAEVCGLLPSVLGAGTSSKERTESCRERCEATTEDNREDVVGALGTEPLQLGGQDAAEQGRRHRLGVLWCDGDAEVPSTCEGMTTDLSKHMNMSTVELRVDVVCADPTAPSAAQGAASCRLVPLVPSPFRPRADEQVCSISNGVGYEVTQFQLYLGNSQSSGALSCGQITRTYRFRELRPGRHRVALEVSGLGSQTGGPTDCARATADIVIVAGDPQILTFALPPPADLANLPAPFEACTGQPP